VDILGVLVQKITVVSSLPEQDFSIIAVVVDMVVLIVMKRIWRLHALIITRWPPYKWFRKELWGC
jgi:hypothetical protein